MNQKPVGIITMHRVKNYGAFLQAFALQNKITALGYNNMIVDYIPKSHSNFRYYFSFKKNCSILEIVRLSVIDIIMFIPRIIIARVFLSAQSKHLNISKKKLTTIQNELVGDYLCFITGSDQVWNEKVNMGYNDIYFLGFSKCKENKIAYAASFGNIPVSDEYKRQVLHAIQDFNHISVREDCARDLIFELGRLDAQLVLDPVFLLNEKEWKFLIQDKSEASDPYVLLYILGNDSNAVKLANTLGKRQGLKVKKVGWGFCSVHDVDEYFPFATPFEFVKLFLHASVIITNSYHGAVFSTNFSKQFILTNREHNSRLDSLLRTLEISNRYYFLESDNNEFTKIVDYKRVAEKILEMRRKSIEFLQDSLCDCKSKINEGSQ